MSELENAIDAMIDSAVLDKPAKEAPAAPVAAPATPAKAPVKVPAAPADDQDAPADEGETPEGDESQPANDVEKTPWPKSAVNAMERKDKKLYKKDSQIADLNKQLSDAAFLEAQLAKIKGGQAAPVADPADPEPDLSKYNDWAKYNRDLTAWNMRQIEQSKQQAQPGKPDPVREKFITERTEYAVKSVQTLIQSNPEFLPIFQQNADVIDDFSEATKDVLLKSDNPALATAVLAQEGQLENLGEMSPALAEKVIAQAILRGQSLIKQVAAAGDDGDGDEGDDEPQALPAKKVSSAPAPLSAAKAVGQGSKGADKMSEAEFRKKFLE